MKITNKLGLPTPIVKAIENDPYNKGLAEVSVTSLIDPVRITVLKSRHYNDLEEDAADRIYSLQGQSIHTILERAAEGLEAEGYMVERRYYLDVPVGDRTVTLGGQIDVFNRTTGVLQDYKVTSVYQVKDGAKEEYVKQLNIGAYLLKHGYELLNKYGLPYQHGIDNPTTTSKLKIGHAVNSLQIVAILRDWSKTKYKREKEDSARRGYPTTRYPEQQIALVDVPIIPEEEVFEFIKLKCEEYVAAQQLPDTSLPECSDEERWVRDTKYAIVKRGAKRALKLCDTREGAELILTEFGSDAKIESRPGESGRCLNYCVVAAKCNMAKAHGWKP